MLDERQRQAVEAGPIDLFISAGAGSGKTRVLTARFVDAVLGVPPYRAHEPGEILTVTFTDKAAGELAERARIGLADAGRFDLARRMGDAWISTIHGMCSRILRQHALEADVDPHFRTLDAVESGALQMAAINQALASDDDVTLEFIDSYGYREVAQALQSVLADVRSLGMPVSEVAVLTPEQMADAFRTAASEYVALAEELEALATQKTVISNAASARRLALACEACGCDVPPPDSLAALEETLRESGFTHRRAIEGHEDLVDRALEVLATVKRLRAQLRVADAERMFLRLLGEYDRLYAAEKQVLGALDFEDLQLMTVRLLERDTAVAERYRERFAMVMLDEFQDTNRLQLRIARLISRGNLCTVGDENQSIYAFRHADIEVFRQRQAEVTRHVRLDTNYRITPRLLAALNGLFAAPALFGDAYQPLHPPQAEVGAARAGGDALKRDGEHASSEASGDTAASETSAPLEVLFLDTATTPSAEQRRVEAEAIAEQVARLVGGGVRPGDIAVLMAALSGGRGEQVEAALLARGIPVNLSAGGAFFARPEVAAGRALLRTIDNPRDEEALVLLLAGPLGGVSSEGLLALRDHAQGLQSASGRRYSLWEACRNEPCALSESDRISLVRTVEAVEHARRERGRVQLDELLRGSLLRLDADLVCLARDRNGIRAWGNMMKLVRLAREYQGVAHDGVQGFLAYLDQREMYARSEAEAVLGAESESVRVMTIHAAKGLEFGHVVVGGLDRGGGVESPIQMGMVDRVPLLGLKAPDEKGSWEKTESLERVRAARAAIDSGEDRRLLYVAFTRAEDSLAVVVRADPEKDAGRDLKGLVRAAVGMGAAGAIEPGAHGCGDGLVMVRLLQAGETPPAAAVPVTCQTGPTCPPEPVAEGHAQIGATPFITRVSYSGLQQYGQCPYRFYLTRVERLATRPERSTGTAAALGTAVHAVLERIDGARSIDAACDEVARSYTLAAAEAVRLREVVDSLEAMDVRERLRGAKRVMYEAPLLVPISGVILTGSMDAYAREGDRALVVDYKTGAGQPDDATAKEAYRLQAQCYALAALAAGAAEVEVVFAETGPGRETEFRYGRDERAELESVIGGFIERMRAGEYPPRESYDPHLCERCPGFGASCPVRP